MSVVVGPLGWTYPILNLILGILGKPQQSSEHMNVSAVNAESWEVKRDQTGRAQYIIVHREVKS